MRECLQVALWLRGFTAWSRLSGFAALWRDNFAGPCSPYADPSNGLKAPTGICFSKGMFEYHLPFPKVGYVSFLEERLEYPHYQ